MVYNVPDKNRVDMIARRRAIAQRHIAVHGAIILF